MAERISQFVLETDSAGEPDARVAHVVAEAVNVGFPAAEASQLVVEVAYIQKASRGRWYAY